ncbi:MAG: hypothetical protein WCV67_19195 [Victivallaceae bacterium]|jgi:hypothetical protein
MELRDTMNELQMKLYQMELRDIMKALQLEDTCLAAIEPNWDKSAASFPAAIPEFLTPAGYRRNFEYTGLAASLLPVLDDISAKIVNNQELLHLAWHCYQSQYVYPNPSFAKWPWFENILGENSTVFYLLILIAALPLTIKKYQAMGIPEEYAAAICSRARGYYDTYKAGYNRHGINPGQLYWARLYTDAVIFRVGRFEYWPRQLDGQYPFEAYKNDKTGKVLALRTGGLNYNHEGYCLGSGEDQSMIAFTGKYEKTDEYVIGTPINPEGTAAAFNVKLDLREWTQVLGSDDIVLDIHIPEGGKMTLDLCEQSFKDALKFFEKYFPQTKISAFGCCSWIFYPLYEKTMPESNLAAFMRELYLVPWPSGCADGFYFIFGRDYDKQVTYPRDTSIRRAMLDELRTGGCLRSGGMFFLAEHIELFGQKPYRTMLKVEDFN